MVNQKAQQAVQKSLDAATADPKTGVPGLVFVAVDKNGDDIAAVASGTVGLDHKQPMTLETVFWIASCTKLLTSIACMQAVEQGKLSLDDHEQVYKLCPELRDVKVLQDDGTLVDRKKDITLRMLLTHTAGFAYEFFSPKLRDFGRPTGFDVFHADIRDIQAMPLVSQPGERWEYGIGLDWAGIVLERATGVRLNDWIQDHIAKPLGLAHVTMLPSDAMKRQLAHMHQRWPGGSGACEGRDHVYREPLVARTDEDRQRLFHSGGGGAFARPAEYAQVLAALLNGGQGARTGARILQAATVDAMFANQIPHFPDFARQTIVISKPDLSNSAPELYPQPGSPPQGWGLSFMITQEPGATGRGRNTAHWAGIVNLYWWCDREKGVAGMIASQVLPYGDPTVVGQWFACEAAVYDALGQSDQSGPSL